MSLTLVLALAQPDSAYQDCCGLELAHNAQQDANPAQRKPPREVDRLWRVNVSAGCFSVTRMALQTRVERRCEKSSAHDISCIGHLCELRHADEIQLVQLAPQR